MRHLPVSMRLLFLLLIAVSISSVPVHAATFYVSTSGQDLSTRNGSIAQPWRTVAYAANNRVLATGNTIFVNAGTYSETQQISLAPGVSLQGANQATTILTVATGFPSNTLIYLGSNPIQTEPSTISNLTVDGANKTLNHAIDTQGRSNLTFHQLNV